MGGVDLIAQIKERYQIRSLKWRHPLARHIIDGCSSKVREGCPADSQADSVVPEELRLASVENHMPEMVSKHRRCRKCSRKGQKKRTRYMCAECDVLLCIAICLSSFHG
ncbi:hypothetical protein TNCV_2890551 [Trichonephila clavipes]|nr:hypothetical protein TNCV_2890551 [Trichonephila clavipes]